MTRANITSKGRLNRFMRIIMAFILCTCMAMPVHAAKYNTAAQLFYEGLVDDESYVRVLVEDGDEDIDKDDDDYERQYEDIPVIRRSSTSSITVSKNAKVIEELRVVISKKHTLTIAEGVTLTVLGDLVVEGTLINKGTIIIGTKTAVSKNTMYDKKTLKEVESNMNLWHIDNHGTFTNEGKVTVLNGTLSNRPGGKINNKGTITISNTSTDTIGMKNFFVKKNGVSTFGTVDNTGTIYVRNTLGTGIHNYSNAKFNNNGKLYTGPKATIKGKITGEQPKKE